MYKKLLIGSALCCSSLFYGQQNQPQQNIEALEEVVLIDSRFELKRKNSGKVVVKITGEELEKSIGQSLPQVINRVSGIEISGTRGYAGQNLGYYIRGGRNRQVVILIDGVQVNDPSSIANDFDLRLLSLSQVASIEIIKGAASTLYGSGAATAVIHIKTKKPADEPIALTLRSSVGTNQSQFEQKYTPAEFHNSVSAGGTLKKFDYRLNFNQLYSGGLSAVNLLDNSQDYEEDIYKKYNVHVRVGYTPNKNFNVHLFGNYNEFTSNYDNFDFTDSNNQLHSTQTRFGGKLNLDYGKGSLVFTNSLSFLERNIQTDFPNRFESRLYALDTYHKYNFNDSFYTVLGLNGLFSAFSSFAVPFGKENMEQLISGENAHFEITDPYLNVVYVSEFGLHVNTGARLNIHSNYGTHWVYNFNPSYGLNLKNKHLKFLASYSTAYVTPSLYQLYEPNYGNENLLPEESRTIEGGLELDAKNMRFSLVYFNRKEEQYIDFILVDPENFGYQYQNIGETFTADGLELEVSANLLKDLSFSGNYTFTEVEERFALRIPKHKINAQLGFKATPKLFASLSYQFNGERTDAFFDPANSQNKNIVLDNFSLLGFFASYQFGKNLKLFGRLSNITNEKYRELYGYTTLGRNVKLGVVLKI